MAPPAFYSLSGRFDVRIVLQTLTKAGTNPETCTKTNVCTIQTRLILDPSLSEHRSTLSVPAPGDETIVVASSAAVGGVNTFTVGGSCPVTLQSALVGKIASTYQIVDW